MIKLSEIELEEIKSAVKVAELKTSGEIVPYVVRKSANYSSSYLIAAAYFGILTSAYLLVCSIFELGSQLSALTTSAIILGSLIVGALACIMPFFRKMIIGNKTINIEVERRAMNAFLTEEVFNTKDRTGILIFVSLFEKKIEIIGDSGINKKVQPNDWTSISQLMLSEIKQNTLSAGIIKGITAAGDLLQSSGVAIQKDDTNELPNDLRVR